MPFGAHETMEVHEILNEKINLINHLSLYTEQAQSAQLKSLIEHQIQGAIQSYNQLVNYTQNYNAPQTSNLQMNSNMFKQTDQTQAQTTYQDIQYGLQQPASISPQMKGRFTDQQIMSALLIIHKNGAKNALSASLECADPNLRQMLVNASITCANQAFEIFFTMNQQGQYQVPTLNDQTAKTFLHVYQPMNPVSNFQ